MELEAKKSFKSRIFGGEKVITKNLVWHDTNNPPRILGLEWTVGNLEFIKTAINLINPVFPCFFFSPVLLVKMFSTLSDAQQCNVMLIEKSYFHFIIILLFYFVDLIVSISSCLKKITKINRQYVIELVWQRKNKT
jgi:hypothetical protein